MDARTGMETLHTELVSKAQAAQRAGRAGREAAGDCYRLLTEDDFDAREAAPLADRKFDDTRVAAKDPARELDDLALLRGAGARRCVLPVRGGVL